VETKALRSSPIKALAFLLHFSHASGREREAYMTGRAFISFCDRRKRIAVAAPPPSPKPKLNFKTHH
jgi:hypothetical protein